MKRQLFLTFVLLCVPVFQLYAQFSPSASGSTTAAAEINSKPAIQSSSSNASGNCTAGKDVWVNTTNNTVQYCTATNTWGNPLTSFYATLNTAGPGGANPAATGATQRTSATFAYPLQVDNSSPNIVSVRGRCDPRSYICFADEFLSQGNTGNGLISEMQWIVGSGASSGWEASPATGTYGVFKITTGTASGNVVALDIPQSTAAWNVNLAGTTFDLLVRAYISSTATVSQFNGFNDQQAGTYGEGAVNAIGIAFDTNQSDTNYTCVARSGGTSTRTATATAATTGAHTFRIRSTTAGTILCSVDGGTEVSVNTNVPTTTSMMPMNSIFTRTTAARTMEMDFYQGWIAVSR